MLLVKQNVPYSHLSKNVTTAYLLESSYERLDYPDRHIAGPMQLRSCDRTQEFNVSVAQYNAHKRPPWKESPRATYPLGDSKLSQPSRKSYKVAPLNGYVRDDPFGNTNLLIPQSKHRVMPVPSNFIPPLNIHSMYPWAMSLCMYSYEAKQ